ncbi:MAG: DNA/RNA nuclease SfsA [Armatimonadota bacterium]
MPRTLVSARLLRRLNRFAILVKLRDGKIVTAHLPNSGRLQEVLQDGNRFWLVRRQGKNRRTEFDAILAQDGNALVSVDARLPPKLLLEGIDAGTVSEFGKIIAVQTEVRYGNHRIDLKIVNDAFQVWWVETKSVTLVVNGVALFPDAPTSRGREHLKLLTQFAGRGENAAVVFVIQRNDAKCFAPNESADPEFAQFLWEAVNSGVEVFAYKCQVTSRELRISERIPVCLKGMTPQGNVVVAQMPRR